MGWRFRKRIKIFPGFYINISKSGLGINIGPKGANISVGPNGTYVNTGIPGTGLYRRDKVNSSTGIQESSSYFRGQENIPEIDKDEQYTGGSIPVEHIVPHQKTHQVPVKIGNSAPMSVIQDDNHNDGYYGDPSIPYDPKKDLENYHYPTFDLLNKYENSGLPYIDIEEQTSNKNRVVETLRNFGIEISSIKVTVGARITLYEITLAPGINASKLRGLEEDIALALSSYNVQILIPIPGKGTIGIEVPNIRPSNVSMGSIINTKLFQETTMELPCALGKTITNEVFMFDLTKAPHVLIAGSTGQGKSIALNAMIMTLLYKKHPAELKLVLMDPYGVEFGLYAQIAKQFLASLPDESVIVSNSGQAVSTLNSLCKEMEARYELLKIACVKNIQDYNRKIVNRQLNPASGHRFIPYIVVVIDEYGNFIEDKGQDFETPIVQLAQYARAVGIHMIISTKRPTNDIITGVIKANFPTRIAFRLPERIDSQVILDCDGAEELLGNGDILFRAGKSNDCIRIQGAFVETSEIERVNQFISNQKGYTTFFELPDPYFCEEDYYDNDVDMNHLDPLFEDAARLIVLRQEGSTSLIQRKFAIGYNRAGKLMDQLEKAGIIGAAYGSRPREVFITDETSLENLLSQLR